MLVRRGRTECMGLSARSGGGVRGGGAVFVRAEQRVEALDGAAPEGLTVRDLASTETFERGEAGGALGFGADTSAFDAPQGGCATTRASGLFCVRLSLDAAVAVAGMAFCALDIGGTRRMGCVMGSTTKTAAIALTGWMFGFGVVLSCVDGERIGGCTTGGSVWLWRGAAA